MPDEVSMQTIDAIAPSIPVPAGAADAFNAALADAVPSTEYTGQIPLVEKDKLVGIPFVITGFADNESDLSKDGAYVFVRCLLPNGNEVGFNDGGVAIAPVLHKHATNVGDAGTDDREITFPKPLFCRRGLIRSEYDNKDGIHGVTFYLS